MTKGIRILDKENKVVSVKLPDILAEIHNGNTHYWSILEIEATGYFEEGQSYLNLVKMVEESENGLFLSWDNLNALSRKFHQIIWILIIGCKEKQLLHFYKNDQEMYETCDIVIEMFDSSYWKVFSKDEQLIDRLGSKFKNVEFIKPDFQKNMNY